jgi:hypothetical protein
MKTNNLFIACLLLFFCFSCASGRYTSDFDETANFNDYKTFGFSENTIDLPVDDLIKNRILNSIASNLTSKGYTESENPDLIIDLNVKTKNKKDYSSTNVNMSTVWGRRWRFRTGVGQTYHKEINYTEGTLVINIVDMAKNSLVWKGSGTDVVREKNLQAEPIREAIYKIMESFPAK